jgi:hypothetical protein
MVVYLRIASVSMAEKGRNLNREKPLLFMQAKHYYS